MSQSDSVEPAALVRYLRDLAQLRARPILHLENYEFVKWFNDVPSHRACQSAIVEGELDDSPEWLIVDRVELPPRPDTPEIAQQWLVGVDLDRPDREPALQPMITCVELIDTGDGPQQTTAEDHLEDHPEVVQAWSRYLERWGAWAEQRSMLDPVHDLYTDLFRAAERTRQVGEQFETVVAVGLLALNGDRGRLKRHLLTVPAQIMLDAQSGRITVEPMGESTGSVRLEQDMLAPNETPPSNVQDQVREYLSGLDPLDLAVVQPLLETWTNGVSADAQFEPELSGDLSADDVVAVRLAPAIITRQRSQQAVVDTYEAILKEVELGGEVPPTFADLTTTSGGEVSDEEREASGLSLDGEQWFPLPANEEQSQIVQALRSRRGVIVHGPPGTGKSHTIANLISHALATGQRVLVTAHSARALEVLSDKLPDDIRALTVSMLGEGRRGTDDLERSANEILRRRQDPEWSASAIGERLRRLEDVLRGAREARRQLLSRLGGARADELDHLDLGFGGFSGTLAVLAAEISDLPEPPTWLDGRPDVSPPLSDLEVDELVALRASLSDNDLALAGQTIPDQDALPPVDDVASVVSRVARTGASAHEFADIRSDLLDLFEGLDDAALKEYIAAARDVDEASSAVQRRNEAWLTEVLEDLSRGRESAWVARLQHSRDYLNAQRDLISTDQLHVSLPDDASRPALRAQAVELGAFLRDGGKIRRIKSKAVKAAQELLDTVTVNGSTPTTADQCDAFVSWCDEHGALEQIELGWPSGVLASQPNLVLRHAALTDAVRSLEECFALRESESALQEVIARYGIDTHLFPADSRLIARVAEASRAHTEHFDALSDLGAMVDAVKPLRDISRIHPEALELVAALESSDVAAYARHRERLGELRQISARANRYQTQLEILVGTTPAAAELIREGHGEVLRPFETSWNQARAVGWLESREHLDANRLTAEISGIDDRIRDLITEMGANRAWLHAIGRLTDAHTQHLKGYQTAMKRVGKGKSKYDFKYRSEARAHLAQCQDAVPAWVMPAHQVAANVAPVAGSFDLVIVDEASQSGVEELFLFWLGKQVVVVGDKQQISPEGSFVKGEAQDLQRRHLDGWSFAGEFGPENSLFDVAEIKYVSGEVWLSEHFRSMPEIIEYSNQLCYADHRLEPVRQFVARCAAPECHTRARPSGQEEIRMATDSDESPGAPQPNRRRELLAMVRPDKPWSDLTDAEIDALASRMHRQMTERIREADERNAR